MSRWTGSWLGGPQSSGLIAPVQEFQGQRLGLPASGPGSVAGQGRRLAAFGVDALAANAGVALLGLAGLSAAGAARGNLVLAIFVGEVLLLVALFGQSVGMRVLGLQVRRVDGAALPGLGRSALRTALLVLLIPALVTDADGRGLHDKAAGTVIVRT